jgi:hypothetical protein
VRRQDPRGTYQVSASAGGAKGSTSFLVQ